MTYQGHPLGLLCRGGHQDTLGRQEVHSLIAFCLLCGAGR